MTGLACTFTPTSSPSFPSPTPDPTLNTLTLNHLSAHD